ncbi:MAG: hypothetical protein PHU71_00400 [Candidatus Gracilibacteria bacterium]|nr:hypothetical protein [Candidatus Gracilibacteria bacterium]
MSLESSQKTIDHSDRVGTETAELLSYFEILKQKGFIPTEEEKTTETKDKD